MNIFDLLFKRSATRTAERADRARSDQALDKSEGTYPCRCWVTVVEPHEVPGVFPLEATLQPRLEGLRVSMGSKYTQPMDGFSRAMQIGVFHTLSGRGSNEPVLLPWKIVKQIDGRVIAREGPVLKTLESVSEPYTAALPRGAEFRIDMTYRPPRPPGQPQSKIQMAVVADRGHAKEHPQRTVQLYNAMLSARRGLAES